MAAIGHPSLGCGGFLSSQARDLPGGFPTATFGDAGQRCDGWPKAATRLPAANGRRPFCCEGHSQFASKPFDETPLLRLPWRRGLLLQWPFLPRVLHQGSVRSTVYSLQSTVYSTEAAVCTPHTERDGVCMAGESAVPSVLDAMTFPRWYHSYRTSDWGSEIVQ